MNSMKTLIKIAIVTFILNMTFGIQTTKHKGRIGFGNKNPVTTTTNYHLTIFNIPVLRLYI